MFRKKKEEPQPSRNVEKDCGAEWTTGGYAGKNKRLHECGVKVIYPFQMYHDGPHKCKRCDVEKPQ